VTAEDDVPTLTGPTSATEIPGHRARVAESIDHATARTLERRQPAKEMKSRLVVAHREQRPVVHLTKHRTLERRVARFAVVWNLGEVAVGHPDDAIGDLPALDLGLCDANLLDLCVSGLLRSLGLLDLQRNDLVGSSRNGFVERVNAHASRQHVATRSAARASAPRHARRSWVRDRFIAYARREVPVTLGCGIAP
jgi:hypothetical protein